MNMEILFTRPVTDDTATVLTLKKCDTGISITLGNIDFINQLNESENYHFIETDKIDEFISALTFLKSVK